MKIDRWRKTANDLARGRGSISQRIGEEEDVWKSNRREETADLDNFVCPVAKINLNGFTSYYDFPYLV